MKRNIDTAKYQGHTACPLTINYDEAPEGDVLIETKEHGAFIGAVYGTDTFPCYDEEEDPNFERFMKEQVANSRLWADAPALLAELERVYALAERMEAWMKDVLVDSLPMSATMERYAKGLHDEGNKLLADIGGGEETK